MRRFSEKWSSWGKRAILAATFVFGLAFVLVCVPAVAHAEGGEEEAAQGEKNWGDRVTISGAVEVEVGVAKDDSATESDIALATVELGLDAEVSELSSVHVLFLYEGEGDVEVDEASITIGNTEKNPPYLTVGRMYVPFGNYESQMISDPLTLELGETQEDALLLGVEASGFYAALYAFNGDADDGGDDEIEHYGANAGYTFESEGVSVDVGGGWISSIQDSNGLSDVMGPGAFAVNDYIAGYAAHLTAAFGPVTLIGEYVGADDDINGAGTNSQISAYNVEAGVAFPLAGKAAGFAVGFQTTDEAVGVLAEERKVAALSVEIMAGTTLALEWLNEADYDIASGGSGTDLDFYTLQLAAEF